VRVKYVSGPVSEIEPMYFSFSIIDLANRYYAESYTLKDIIKGLWIVAQAWRSHRRFGATGTSIPVDYEVLQQKTVSTTTTFLKDEVLWEVFFTASV